MTETGEPLLEIQGLSTSFFSQDGTVKAVQDASFSLHPGEILGIVGESGSGKTMTALSIMGLVPYPGRVVSGGIRLRGKDLLAMEEDERRKLRGNTMAMIFQDPVASLNPLMTIGAQVAEIINTHMIASSEAIHDGTLDALKSVGLPEPERVATSYPWELSGGMCQRVMLAMMMILEPELLLADEPTSSLDTTLQAEMLERIQSLSKEHNTAVILITHNMGVVARVADRVMVMYGGRMMETAETVELFTHPAHPYTWALLNAVPRLDDTERGLRAVSGAPPDLVNPVDECPFLARCHKATVACRTSPMPPMEQSDRLSGEHLLACYNPIWQERGVDGH